MILDTDALAAPGTLSASMTLVFTETAKLNQAMRVIADWPAFSAVINKPPTASNEVTKYHLTVIVKNHQTPLDAMRALVGLLEV